jgi:hypothetical protein
VRTFAFPRRGDFLDLVDEEDDALEVLQLCKGLAQRGSETAGRVGCQPRGENLDESPAQPRGDGFGEGRFSGTGGAEQHDRARRAHPKAGGFLRAFQGEHDAALDELLLMVHPRHVRPSARMEHLAAKALEQADLRRCCRVRAARTARRRRVR